MKTDIKALPLSLALSFLALLGACSSVNSTPNSEVPSGDSSVILEDGQEGVESVEDLAPEDVTGEATTEDSELETAEFETTDEMEEPAAIDGDMTEDETAEEVDPTEIILPEGDSAEVETDEEAADNVIPDVNIETQPE